MDGIFFIHLQTLHYHIYSMTYRLSVTSSVNFGRIYQFEWTIFTNNNDIKLYTRTRINNSTIDMTNELGQHKRAAARVLYNSNGRSSSSEFYALQKIFFATCAHFQPKTFFVQSAKPIRIRGQALGAISIESTQDNMSVIRYKMFRTNRRFHIFHLKDVIPSFLHLNLWHI